MIQAPLFGLSAADKNTQCQMASAITDEFDTIEILSIIIVTNRATGESNTEHDYGDLMVPPTPGKGLS